MQVYSLLNSISNNEVKILIDIHAFGTKSSSQLTMDNDVSISPDGGGEVSVEGHIEGIVGIFIRLSKSSTEVVSKLRANNKIRMCHVPFIYTNTVV